jgi:hypothetical protein
MNSRHHATVFLLIIVMAVVDRSSAAAGDKPVDPKELLAESLTAARAITDRYERDNALLRVVRGQCAVGDVAGAEQTGKLIAAPQFEGFARGTIAGARARAGDIKGALALADAAADGRGSVLEEVVEAQIEQGDLPGAKATRAGMGEGFDSGQADRRIAIAQAALDDVTAARQTLAGIQDAYVKVQAYLDVAEALFKTKNLTAARYMIQRAVAASNDVPDYLRSISIASIVSTEVRTGSAEIALATAKRIVQSDSKELALAKIAEAQVAIGNLADSEATAGLLHDSGNLVRLKAFFAKAKAKKGDSAGAKQSIAASRALADKIQKPTHRAFAYETFLPVQVEVGDAAGAIAIAQSQKDPIVRSYSLVAVACALAKK